MCALTKTTMWRKTILIFALVATIAAQNILAIQSEEPDYVNKSSKNPYTRESKGGRTSRAANGNKNVTRIVKSKNIPNNVLISRASSVSPVVEQLSGVFESKRLNTKGRSNVIVSSNRIPKIPET